MKTIGRITSLEKSSFGSISGLLARSERSAKKLQTKFMTAIVENRYNATAKPGFNL
jgi:hypothetical protein